GLDEALARAKAFAKAGADVLFVEAPESEDEFRRVGAELAGHAKLLANMVPSGKSPDLGAQKLQSLGFSIAIYPSAGMSVACEALERSFSYLKKAGTLQGSPVPAYDMKRLHELAGFQDVWDFEKRHVEPR
ncbi:MAG TPA: isocitrate lyase/phosphoenolpyruvate mutase family protein, partial [Burkholderiales bacterium]|nr:isocitrate lyase/phosphoenolpyruvate mutase family protein [Burkholderiales bacterium]